MQQAELQQKKVTAQDVIKNFGLAVTYALFLRTQPDDVYRKCLQLIMEKHQREHDASIPFLECFDIECQQTAQMLQNKLLPLITLTPEVVELMKAFAIQVVEKDATISFVLTQPQQVEAKPLVESTEIQRKADPESSGLKLVVSK